MVGKDLMQKMDYIKLFKQKDRLDSKEIDVKLDPHI